MREDVADLREKFLQRWVDLDCGLRPKEGVADLDGLLTAARRAGAEEMRDKLVALTSANCQGRCVTLPEEVRRICAALHPDAKGGDHA